LNVSGNVIKRVAASCRRVLGAGSFACANGREYSMRELVGDDDDHLL
jgi:hypothetical protein